ncbi:DUF6880 family protein [Methylobacterium sp. A54F]
MARRAPRASSEPAAAKPASPRSELPKGARRTTPSPETLQALGPDRLIGLILGETARNPAFKKLVSAALAALQGPDAVAAIVDRRLAALEGARGFIDWQKRRAFAADLDATVSVILRELRPLDPGAALERLLRFLRGSEAVLARVDDPSGATQGLYERAADAAIEIAAALPPEEAERFALGLVAPFAADPFGTFGPLLRDLVGRLPVAALPALADALEQAEHVAPKPGRRGSGDWPAAVRRLAFLRVRQDVARRRGDIDAVIALERSLPPEQQDRAGMAETLLEVGRAEEALDWLRMDGPRVGTRADLIAGAYDARPLDGGWTALEVRALDALDRRDEAQTLRWTRFTETLDAEMLRAYLAKLPDFEDEEALSRALDHAAAFPNPHRALAFLIAWPDPERAAQLVRAQPKVWDGERYAILAPAAEALEADHPDAAAILYRRLIDDVLGKGRSQAYTHAARYLLQLELLAPELPPAVHDQAAYRAALRKAHGRKYGFWSLLPDG